MNMRISGVQTEIWKTLSVTRIEVWYALFINSDRSGITQKTQNRNNTHAKWRLYTYVAFYLGGGETGAINRKNASYVSSYILGIGVYGMNVPLKEEVCRQNQNKILILL
jgi:hypothetical protein